jgi:hypothetical protein
MHKAGGVRDNNTMSKNMNKYQVFLDSVGGGYFDTINPVACLNNVHVEMFTTYSLDITLDCPVILPSKIQDISLGHSIRRLGRFQGSFATAEIQKFHEKRKLQWLAKKRITDELDTR